ncbi:MAG: hypothetical protein KAR12_06610, partial [Methylococcales bacterium]|nr:hypothetical protein [Methylococcales bacterium]
RTITKELLEEIDKLNSNSDVHGILLQHPVPSQFNERQCFDRIRIEKDVDGVTCYGFGRIAMKEPAYGSATIDYMLALRCIYFKFHGKTIIC